MTLTNKLNLPEPIVRAVTRDPYDRGGSDFTATELDTPARARALKRQHRDELTEDISERIFALCGQIGHTLLERAGDPHIVERRFFAKVATFTVSGQADLIIAGDEAELTDYKFCSIWTTLNGIKPEWTHQANVLRYLASEDQNPVNITKASIIAIYRDWSKPKAQRESDYPQAQVAVLPVELWPLEKTADWICERIAKHIMAEKILPLCTDEERWYSPGKFAVMRTGRKSAVKLYDTEEEALDHVETDTKALYLDHRKGESKRCANYCQAFPFCSQAQAEISTP